MLTFIGRDLTTLAAMYASIFVLVTGYPTITPRVWWLVLVYTTILPPMWYALRAGRKQLLATLMIAAQWMAFTGVAMLRGTPGQGLPATVAWAYIWVYATAPIMVGVVVYLTAFYTVMLHQLECANIREQSETQ
jgi:hypothetical protein